MGDESLLQSGYNKLMGKLGFLGGIIKTAMSQIDLKIKAEDAESTRAKLHELKEAALEVVEFCDLAIEDLADDKLTLIEGGGLALKLESVIDEVGDIASGVDEDG